MNYENAIEKLEKDYLKLIDQNIYPINSWLIGDKRVKPAIPFVGKEYFNQAKGQKVLIYASAENLTWCTSSEYLWYTEKSGMLRSRHNFEEQGKNLVSEYEFPDIHIQPIHDGGLLIVANRAMRNLFHANYQDTPREFVEKISCANYGKYTIINPEDASINKDYADNRLLLDISKEYARVDIEILNPDIILVPKTIYYGQKEFFDSISENRKILHIMQINPTNVNCHIFKKSRVEEYKSIELTEIEKIWLDNLRRFNKEKFMSVYDYVDNTVCK